MTIQEISRVHQARPFEPFRVHVADGRVFTVLHPEFMHQSPSGRMIYISTPDDSMVSLDLLLVTGLETGMKTRNGRPKNRG
jgi:hypothetical protein